MNELLEENRYISKKEMEKIKQEYQEEFNQFKKESYILCFTLKKKIYLPF